MEIKTFEQFVNEAGKPETWKTVKGHKIGLDKDGNHVAGIFYSKAGKHEPKKDEPKEEPKKEEKAKKEKYPDNHPKYDSRFKSFMSSRKKMKYSISELVDEMQDQFGSKLSTEELRTWVSYAKEIYNK